MATPSLAMIPSGYKDGTLYSVLPNNAGGDFNVTRGSLATRVNKNGLIEPVGTLGADVVLNGDFEETGADQVLNGDFAQEGAEVVTNGDFATDSDWTKEAGITISGGSANFTGVAGNYLHQTCLTNGTRYHLTFDVSAYTSGVLTVFGGANNGVSSSTINSVGSYSFYFTAGGLDTKLYFGSVFAGSIDNVSVKEVGQNWSLGTGWSIGDDKVTIDGSGGNISNLSQDIGVLPSKSYKISFSVSDFIAGDFRVSVGSQQYSAFSDANGDYVYYITTAAPSTGVNTIFYLQGVNSADFSISNITVEEVGQEWTLTDGCSITAQGARITSDGISQQITQSNVLVIGDTYEIEYEITESVSGTIGFTTNFDNLQLKNTVGVHKFYGVAQNSTTLQIKRVNSPTDITIDNIKVKRLTGDDTPRIDYTDGGCPVLLTEPQSTNIISNSNDFSLSIWIKGAIASIPSGFTSPDGSGNATKIIPNTANSVHKIRTNQITTPSVGTEVTFSVFCKSEEMTKVALVDSWTNLTYTVIDLSTSSVIEEALGTTSVTEFSNGFKRISFSYETSNVNTIPNILLLDDGYTSGNPTSYSFSGNDVDGLYIYGAQLEELSYATSYIPTYGAVRTRLQDAVKNLAATSLIGQAQGTIFLDYNSTTHNGEVLSVNRSTTNSIHIFTSSAGALRVQLYSDGAVRTYSLTSDLESRGKVAISYENNSQKIYFNGALVQSFTDSWTPNIAMTRISMNEGGYVSQKCKTNVGALQLFKTALTDFELTQLTTI